METMENITTNELTYEEALREVINALEVYGKPVWVAHVPTRVRKMIPANIKAELIANAGASEGWRTASDDKADILSWAKNNVFELVTVKELTEIIGGITEAQVRKVVTSRPDIFLKRESHQYEVRDPQADRKADK